MAETLTLERAVEAMARQIDAHAFGFPADAAPWVEAAHGYARKKARAALAALVKEAGLDRDAMRAAWVTTERSAHEIRDAFGSKKEQIAAGYDAAAALLRVLAEASDAPA